MIISMNYYKARKNYVCKNCGKKIDKGLFYYRLFGAAFEGDKPYELIECCTCVDKAGECVDEVRRALKKVNKRKVN